MSTLLVSTGRRGRTLHTSGCVQLRFCKNTIPYKGIGDEYNSVEPCGQCKPSIADAYNQTDRYATWTGGDWSGRRVYNHRTLDGTRIAPRPIHHHRLVGRWEDGRHWGHSTASCPEIQGGVAFGSDASWDCPTCIDVAVPPAWARVANWHRDGTLTCVGCHRTRDVAAFPKITGTRDTILVGRSSRCRDCRGE